jgi:hypothetical protein
MLKNVADQVIEFAPRDSSGALVPGCGATLTLYVAKDGAALGAAAGTLTEKTLTGPVNTGLLKYVPTQAETNCDVLTLFWQDSGDAQDDALSIETNPGWTEARAASIDALPATILRRADESDVISGDPRCLAWVAALLLNKKTTDESGVIHVRNSADDADLFTLATTEDPDAQPISGTGAASA